MVIAKNEIASNIVHMYMYSKSLMNTIFGSKKICVVQNCVVQIYVNIPSITDILHDSLGFPGKYGNVVLLWHNAKC